MTNQQTTTSSTDYKDGLCRLQKTSNETQLFFAFAGEIDLENLASISRWVEDHLDHSHEQVVFQLKNLNYVDSAGISWLFHLCRKLRTHSQDLCLEIPQGHPLRKLFSMVKLDKVANVEEAF